ncbi:type II toxin-antitoxin system MqsA family antitoxin [Methylomicrobium sp. Wu6]|uniref:type II toxin-antitoxin system MqsA family antitoxin n=1 Tax=Methylomicrobium sp. Wu6 TaxID=3107928 RepID=UPI002DD68EBB|nr:type II toxin-antitoxin system MqsA family antitoxin [Methylomicrobium sp. Wu6]MEC4747449.1 type II toxin-antitoxin system MqsA family antitoxin [Methylomicrobium sp. Wu6]
MNKAICADCGADALQAFTEIEQFDYKGHLLSAEVEYSVCAKCGAEAILPDQIKRNDCRVRDAWRKVDGLLTGCEIVGLRAKLGLTQQQAAQYFGGGTNAFSKYERGEVIQSAAMDKLMRLALEDQPVDVGQWLSDHSGLHKDAPQAGYGKVIPFKPKSKPLSLIASPIAENYQELNHG